MSKELSNIGKVTSIQTVKGCPVLTIELSNPNKGLWYIGANDEKRDEKMVEAQKTYDERVTNQAFGLGKITLTQGGNHD